MKSIEDYFDDAGEFQTAMRPRKKRSGSQQLATIKARRAKAARDEKRMVERNRSKRETMAAKKKTTKKTVRKTAKKKTTPRGTSAKRRTTARTGTVTLTAAQLNKVVAAAVKKQLRACI